MKKLRDLEPTLRCVDLRTVKPAPRSHGPWTDKVKKVDRFYVSKEFRAWRAKVVAKAGGQCEHVDFGNRRCPRRQPEHRMFADHIIEVKDGGAPYDKANGQCLCGSHHLAKTARVRRLRANQKDGRIATSGGSWQSGWFDG